MEHPDELLKDLLDRHTDMTETGFSINVAEETDRWDQCMKSLGIHAAYKRMAEHLCAMYEARYGEPFLFSERCVAYEIEYHVDAYMTVQGYRGYGRNVTTLLFSKEALRRHCAVVDISTTDVANLKQRLMFGYRRGIRACYRRTEKDPFRRKRA